MKRELRHLIRESDRLANAGDFGVAALRVNSRLLGLAPTNEVRSRVASCLDEAGRLDEARAAYLLVLEGLRGTEEAIRVRIRTVDEKLNACATADFHAAWSRAQELKVAAEPRLALIWHERTVELSKTPRQGAKAFASWASTLRTLRLFKEAVTVAGSSVELDSDPETNLAGYAAYIGALRATGAFIEAANYADKLLAEHPDHDVARNAAGAAYHALGMRTSNAELREKAKLCRPAAMAIGSGGRWQ